MPRKIRVLCLDDQVDNLKTRKIFLEQFGFEVIIVTDGRSCLRLATEGRFDIALLDYHLGGAITGEDVARDLRACSPGLPLIMLTGDPKIPLSAKKSVDAVLLKGKSSPADLLAWIRQLAKCEG
jgi:CheY-like chemotaxis protein